MTRKSMTLAVSLILVLVACNAIGPTKTLTVSAAASLTESFSDLGRQFEAAHPGAKVVFNFAGSQQLVAQLELGARADVLASASVKDMNAAISASLVASGTVRIFAHNQLVIIYPPNNPGKIAALTDLARPQVGRIDEVIVVPSCLVAVQALPGEIEMLEPRGLPGQETLLHRAGKLQRRLHLLPFSQLGPYFVEYRSQSCQLIARRNVHAGGIVAFREPGTCLCQLADGLSPGPGANNREQYGRRDGTQQHDPAGPQPDNALLEQRTRSGGCRLDYRIVWDNE